MRRSFTTMLMLSAVLWTPSTAFAGGPIAKREIGALAADGEATPAGETKHGKIVAGWDSVNARPRFVEVDATGNIIVVPLAGAVTDTNLVKVAGTAVEGPYDVDGGAGNERIQGVAVRTAGAAGASSEGVIIRLNDGTAVGPGADSPVPISDDGGTLTVDAPLATPVHTRISDGVEAVNVTAANELNVLATAQPGVDVGDVTVNNGAAGAAVNVQDGGNVLSVDSLQLPAALVGGRLDVIVGAELPAGTQNIGDVDVVSVTPLTGAANLGKAVDAIAGAGDTGVAPVAVRDDALGALVPLEGDYVQQRVDANGALWTHDDALDAALAGSELQVDVVTSALPAGAATEATLATRATEVTAAAILADTATIDTQTAAIKTAVEIIDNAIAGAEMQVDVVTSALPAGAATEATLATRATEVTAAAILADTATIDSQTLAIKTAVEIIDNAIAGSEMQTDVVTEPATAADGALGLPAVTKVVAGWDGANVQALALDAAGQAQIDVLTSALPTGAATEATLATRATEATAAAILADTATIDSQTLAIKTAVEILDNAIAGAEMQVDVVTSALPAGAATEATLATRATEATAAAILADTATIDAQTLAIQTAVQVIDNIVAGSEAQVDIVTEPATAADGAVGLPATLKVVAGWDGVNVQALATDAGGNAQVDVLTSALPTGAATEVTAAAILADTATIDAQTLAIQTAVQIIDNIVAGAEAQVDVVTSALPAGAATSALQTQPGVDIGDVTVNNAAGAAAVNVQDGGNSFTVDQATATNLRVSGGDAAGAPTAGTVLAVQGIAAGTALPISAAALPLPAGAATEATLATRATEVTSAAILADTAAIQTAVETIDNAIAGAEMQVDVITSALPAGAATEATLATLATQATAAAILADTATIDSQTLAIQTAVQIIDNIVAGSEAQVDIVASLPAGSANIGAIRTTPLAMTTQAGTTVACTDTGAVAFTSNALDRFVSVWNTDTADDVCIGYGTAGVPDITTPSTCDLYLGAWAGTGTPTVVALPDGFGASFECDTAVGTTATLRVAVMRE